MSHIDTFRIARPAFGTANRPETGLARSRPQELPPVRGRGEMHETLREQGSPVPAQGQDLESVLAISAPDLERLESMSREQMFAQLVHIEQGLKAKVAATQDTDMRLSLETGLQMIGETIRRIHLINSGIAALVVK